MMLIKLLSLSHDLIPSNNILSLWNARFWEAITRWNEAISLTPNNERLYEMKSQVIQKFFFLAETGGLCGWHMVFQKILFLQNFSQIFPAKPSLSLILFCKSKDSLGFVEKDALSLAVSQSHELASFHPCLCFSCNLIINNL